MELVFVYHVTCVSYMMVLALSRISCCSLRKTNSLLLNCTYIRDEDGC